MLWGGFAYGWTGLDLKVVRLSFVVVLHFDLLIGACLSGGEASDVTFAFEGSLDFYFSSILHGSAVVKNTFWLDLVSLEGEREKKRKLFQSVIYQTLMP